MVWVAVVTSPRTTSVRSVATSVRRAASRVGPTANTWPADRAVSVRARADGEAVVRPVLVELRPALAGENVAIEARYRPTYPFRNRRWQSPGRNHKKLPNSPHEPYTYRCLTRVLLAQYIRP
jgi:hypothetical protein